MSILKNALFPHSIILAKFCSFLANFPSLEWREFHMNHVRLSWYHVGNTFNTKRYLKNGVFPPLSSNDQSLKNYVRSRIQIDSILLFSCFQLHSTFTHIDHIHSKPCTFVAHPQFQRIFFQDFDLLKIGKLWSKFSGWRSRDGENLTGLQN